MECIREYLNQLPVIEQERFAVKCGTTLGYLRKAISKGQALGENIVINMERESGRKIRCEQVRPDVDWAFIRGTRRGRA